MKHSLLPPAQAPADVNLDRHRDFDPAEADAWIREVAAMHAREPLTPRDAIVVQPGEPPRRWRIDALVGHYRANGLHTLARRVARTHVAPGRAMLIVVGDEGVRVHTCAVKSAPDTLAELATLEADAKAWAAPPSAVDGELVPGEPWRRRRWIAPLPTAKRGSR